MRNKNFKNIGNVAVSEINLCDSEIGLHMPIKKMSSNIQEEYEKCETWFSETVSKKFPEINFKDYTLYRDIALHMNIHNEEVVYTVAIILWIEDDQGKEIHVEFYDPFEIEINDEDNRYLKKLVMRKLIDSFF